MQEALPRSARVSISFGALRTVGPDAAEEGPLMLGWKKQLAVIAGVGVLSLMGCRSGNHFSSDNQFSISGAVTGAAAVTVSLAGAASASAATDADGNYSFGSLGNGSYIVTPSKA